MKTVQEQIEQSLHVSTRHHRIQVERPSGWLLMFKGGLVLVGLTLLILLVTAGQVVSFAFNDPARTPLMRYNQRTAIKTGLDQDIYQVWVPVQSIPQKLRDVIVLAQDEQFFYHNGFHAAHVQERSWSGTILANWRDQRNSLTNQVVRNLMLGRRSDGVVYMARERLCTTFFELFLTKDRILELYLNTIHLGPGIYGVEQGARYHFGTPANKLTLEQSCRLAVVIESPLELRVYQERVTNRAALLAQRMGVISTLPIATLPGAFDPVGNTQRSM